MILSVSRRTDIPNYYPEWFYNRIKEGFVYVRNPMNPHQISKIDLSPELVDCIVFWTKNPEPMMNRLEELQAYPYYFQFSLTGYGTEIERGIPDKRGIMIPVFQKLSEKIGKTHTIWRYDPIIFTPTYTKGYHLKAFGQIAEALKGYTNRCVISFVDMYAKNRKNLQDIQAIEPDEKEIWEFARQISKIAAANGMKVGSCAESIDLKECGIEHNCCVDKRLIEEIIGTRLNVKKDKNQRPECGCVESIDIGTYNTCRNECRYCYANHSPESVLHNCDQYDPDAPLLCGVVTEADVVRERAVQSWKDGQMRIYPIE